VRSFDRSCVLDRLVTFLLPSNSALSDPYDREPSPRSRSRARSFPAGCFSIHPDAVFIARSLVFRLDRSKTGRSLSSIVHVRIRDHSDSTSALLIRWLSSASITPTTNNSFDTRDHSVSASVVLATTRTGASCLETPTHELSYPITIVRSCPTSSKCFRLPISPIATIRPSLGWKGLNDSISCPICALTYRVVSRVPSQLRISVVTPIPT
jgi:hypothetical protein